MNTIHPHRGGFTVEDWTKAELSRACKRLNIKHQKNPSKASLCDALNNTITTPTFRFQPRHFSLETLQVLLERFSSVMENLSTGVAQHSAQQYCNLLNTGRPLQNPSPYADTRGRPRISNLPRRLWRRSRSRKPKVARVQTDTAVLDVESANSDGSPIVDVLESQPPPGAAERDVQSADDDGGPIVDVLESQPPPGAAEPDVQSADGDGGPFEIVFSDSESPPGAEGGVATDGERGA